MLPETLERRQVARRLRIVAQSVIASSAGAKRFKRFIECGNVPYSKEDMISLNYSPSTDEAFTGGLSSCGSTWLCPECSSKVMAYRCKSVQTAITKWCAESPENAVYMVTLTQSHNLKDKLKNMLPAQADALSRFWSNGSVKRLMKSIGLGFRISTLEITYGRNTGWHPHRHILLFCKRVSDVAVFEVKLRSYWWSALSSVDCKGNDYALRVDGGAYASEYVTKLAKEVTLSSLKRSPDGFTRYTPFALLAYISEYRKDKQAIQWAYDAFREYAETTKGRHAFQFSKGFSEYFNIEEVTDENIAALHPEDSQFVGGLSFALYKEIRCNSEVFWGMIDLVSVSRDMAQVTDYLRRHGYAVSHCVVDDFGREKVVQNAA